MTFETREVELTPVKDSGQEPEGRPTVIPWKGEPMVRTHSVRACVQEILHAVAVQDSQDVVNINMVGDPSSGKTEQCKTLAHLIHKMSGIPFSVRLFKREDLLDFKKTIKGLSPTNYVLIFDDLSFLGANASAKQIEQLKKEVTEIRHLPGGQDIKIVMIKNFHYTKAIPKYLRQQDFYFFTTVGTSELGNIAEIVGSEKMKKVFHFQRIKNLIKIAPEGSKVFTYKLGRRGQLTYKYRNPFIPMLYYNGISLRHIVSPTRKWIDPICSTCEEFTSREKFENEIDIPKFINQSNLSYGESTFKAAVLLKLKDNGINAFRPNIMSAYRFLDKVLEKKNVSLEDIAIHYGLKQTKTKMKKNVDAILAKSDLEPKKDQDKELLDMMLEEKQDG